MLVHPTERRDTCFSRRCYCQIILLQMVLSNPVGKRQNYFPTVSSDDHIGRRGYRKSILLKTSIHDPVGKRLGIFPTQESIASFSRKKEQKNRLSFADKEICSIFVLQFLWTSISPREMS